MKKTTNTHLYRWMILSRVLAATLGGYVLSALVTSLLALLLPRVSGSDPASVVQITTLLSFVLYTAIVIWVFSTASAWRAWFGLGLAALLTGAVIVGLTISV
ncbi:DUF3649 domain-containing protein [Pseudomonas syringae]|nr:DUF3649 domain-containing protein [Pseudomonas syringae]